MMEYPHACIHAYFTISVSELNKKQETAKKNLEKVQAQLKSTDAELTSLKKVATYICHHLAQLTLLSLISVYIG